jgi:hypothetical protein
VPLTQIPEQKKREQKNLIAPRGRQTVVLFLSLFKGTNMRKFTYLLCAAALVGASTSAIAMDMHGDMKMDMKMMDANGDGMISKEEFMKHHEMMYDKMKKNKDGMVDMKDMGMMPKGKAKGKGNEKGDAMMKDKIVN